LFIRRFHSGDEERGGYGLEARNVAMWLVWENCGMSQPEIGELSGGLHYSAVAQRLRRLPQKSKKGRQ
jgi:chromosomal replication initiation ATPase DnaA